MRILLVNEASFLKSGYAIYGYNLLSRLHKDGFDVAELAIFNSDYDNKIATIPWKFINNQPVNEAELNSFNQIYGAQYGKFRFEESICRFKPHVVIDIRDPFMYDYEYYSPLRDKYHWFIMAPLDGVPQQPQWMQLFKDADSVFTYTDWGKEYLRSFGINAVETASPAASKNYFPINDSDIQKIKKAFGFENRKIIGSIMRNQPRKLFDTLIESFSKIEDKSALLYLHTAIPDVGFDILKILKERNVLSKTIFTYICANCKKCTPMFFSDIVTFCPHCKQKTMKMPDVYTSLSEEHMNKILNIFDVYVQCASREGFGMPQAEAAACGIPIITIPYAGMKDIEKYIKLVDVVKTDTFKLNNQMHMYEACPDVNSLTELINKNLNNPKNRQEIRKSFEEKYSSWDNVYEIWKNRLLSIDVDAIEKNQQQPYNINTDFVINKNLEISVFAKNLISTFLDKRYIGSFMHSRLINDLHHEMTYDNINNYFIKHFEGVVPQAFNKDIAINIFAELAKNNIYWRKKYNESIGN